MYLYLSLLDRKVAEFYHNIDRRSWLVWVKMTYFHHFFRTIPGVFICFSQCRTQIVALLGYFALLHSGQQQSLNPHTRCMSVKTNTILHLEIKWIWRDQPEPSWLQRFPKQTGLPSTRWAESWCHIWSATALPFDEGAHCCPGRGTLGLGRNCWRVIAHHDSYEGSVKLSKSQDCFLDVIRVLPSKQCKNSLQMTWSNKGHKDF